MNKKLAKITKASLEIQSRGILNFWIEVDYEDGLSQSVGGIVLDCYDEAKKKRVGTAYGCEVIRRLLIALGVDDFAQMEGKHVWVLVKEGGCGFEPKGIQRLATDGGSEPVVFDDIAREFGVFEN